MAGLAQRISTVLGAAVISSSLVLAGCSSTATSTSNAPLEGSAVTQPAREKAVVGDPDSVRPADVINRSRAHVSRTGEIYLMRGLANVFSRGIDVMATKMRSRGFDASNFSYKYWQPIAEDIVARSRRGEVSYPVVIIGHSLGGNESSKFASYLGRRDVRVSLVVAFDPVEPGRVGKNIDKVINYYLPKDRTDNRIMPVDGFDGEIQNINVTTDPEVTHMNVEKNREFQAATMNSVMSLTRSEKRQVVETSSRNRLVSREDR